MSEHTPLGPYAVASLFEATLVSVGPRPTDVRVQVDAHPVLGAWLDALQPEELFAPVAAAAEGQKHALPPIPGSGLDGRQGWLVHSGPREYTLWSEESDRAFQGDARLLRACLELYARAVLKPWDGRIAVPPGAALGDGDAPAWVDRLRKAQVALLAVLGRMEQPLFARTEGPAGGDPFRTGRFASAHLKAAVLPQRGGRPGLRVRVADDALSELLAALEPEEVADVAAAVRRRAPVSIAERSAGEAGAPRPGASGRLDGDVWTFTTGQLLTRISHPDLCAVLALAARAVLAPWAGLPVSDGGDGAPGWVGRLRRLDAQLRGLAPDHVLERVEAV